MNDELRELFTAALYVTSYGIVRVGSPLPPMITAILTQCNCTSMAILGAENPMGVTASEEYNNEHHGELGSILARRGLPFIETIGRLNDWEERHFAIFGMDADEAIKLARVYDQAAIVFATIGNDAELRWV